MRHGGATRPERRPNRNECSDGGDRGGQAAQLPDPDVATLLHSSSTIIPRLSIGLGASVMMTGVLQTT